jgi:transposase
MQTRRYALTDTQWERLRPLLPEGKPTGRPARDSRHLLDAMPWVLHAGAPWRDLPERFGPWQTAYHRFSLYRKVGVWQRVLETLQSQAGLDHSQWNLDGTVVRAARPAAGAAKKKSAARGGAG